MTTQKTQDGFPVLTEEEHDRIGKLWRADTGASLVQRYVSVYWAIFPQVAHRLGATVDVLTAYLDQIAHAVIGQAIKDNLLCESSAELLIEAIYYQAGGLHTLGERGRFCFCPDCVRFDHRPGRRHSSNCDGLWQAYCHAVYDLLRYPRCLLTTGMPYAFLDLTTLECGKREPGETVALQQAIAAYLHLDVRFVQEMWVQFIEPLPSREDVPVSQQLALQCVQDFAMHALIPVIEDDAGLLAVSAFMLALQEGGATTPFWMGVLRENQQRWCVRDPANGQGRLLSRERGGRSDA